MREPCESGLCFFLEVLNNPCATRRECITRMGLDQDLLYARIMDLARGGDPVWVGLAEGLRV